MARRYRAQGTIILIYESTEKRLNDEPNIGKNTEEKQEPEGFPMNSNSKHILQSPNDSGPYEEIEEDTPFSSNVHDIDRNEETLQRPPLGRLPSYISLTSFKDDVNDHELDERICLSKGLTRTEETGGEQNITEEYEERLI